MRQIFESEFKQTQHVNSNKWNDRQQVQIQKRNYDFELDFCLIFPETLWKQKCIQKASPEVEFLWFWKKNTIDRSLVHCEWDHFSIRFWIFCHAFFGTFIFGPDFDSTHATLYTVTHCKASSVRSNGRMWVFWQWQRIFCRPVITNGYVPVAFWIKLISIIFRSFRNWTSFSFGDLQFLSFGIPNIFRSTFQFYSVQHFNSFPFGIRNVCSINESLVCLASFNHAFFHWFRWCFTNQLIFKTSNSTLTWCYRV